MLATRYTMTYVKNHNMHNDSCHEYIYAQVMPLCGTRPFEEKLREELCVVDANGNLEMREVPN